MKKVSLKDLKENLSTWVELAHRGNPVEVMKYNQPFVMIVPLSPPDLHLGVNAGKVQLKACLKGATKGRWLDYLEEDRNE